MFRHFYYSELEYCNSGKSGTGKLKPEIRKSARGAAAEYWTGRSVVDRVSAFHSLYFYGATFQMSESLVPN